jgi:uncharacterized protein DUF3105
VAKKSKTPDPPKRAVQAPKVRSDPRRQRDPRRTRMILFIVGGIVLIALIAGGIAFAVGGGGGGDTKTIESACKLTTHPGQGQKHITTDTLPKGFKYNSYPPTSGTHFQTPLIFGEYQEPVLQTHLVHNLEHGGVGVQYGSGVSEETVQKLIEWYGVDARGLVLAPLPDDPEAAALKDKIALSAWVATRDGDPTDPNTRVTKQTGTLAICSRFDEAAFNAFLDKYRGKGPEYFPLDSLAPGN